MMQNVIFEETFLTHVDASDIAERLVVMRRQEENSYRCRDYFNENARNFTGDNLVNESCRSKMCEWCYQVVDFCKFRRETVAIAMSYLDRYLCTHRGKSTLTSPKQFQLAAMTSLYIAIKIHEPLEMDVKLLAQLSRGFYGPSEFVEMEQDMLTALEWRVGGGVTPLCFVQHFLALAVDCVDPSVLNAIMDFAQYQTELAVGESSLIDSLPSVIGFASILNGMGEITNTYFPLEAQANLVRLIEKYSGLVVNDVLATQSCLGFLMTGNHAQVAESEIKRAHHVLAEESLACRQSPVTVVKH